MTEADIMRSIMLACRSSTVRLFRNNVGKLPDRLGRWVTYGLGVGSADLIGINGGRFVAIEVKLPGQKATQEQQDFINMVRSMGGQAGVAHNVEEAIEILAKP